MSIFERIFGKKASDEGQSEPSQQAVLAHLDGTDLADNVSEEFDLSTLEDRLIEVIVLYLPYKARSVFAMGELLPIIAAIKRCFWVVDARRSCLADPSAFPVGG